MGGFFFLEEVYYLVTYLSSKYPQMVTPLFNFGLTYQKKNMLAFAIGIDSGTNFLIKGFKNESIAKSINSVVENEIDESISLESAKKWSMFESKSNVLLTALHHAREPLSLNMLVYLMIDALWMGKQQSFLFENHLFHKFFWFGNFVFIPAVNRDSYEFINSIFGTENWDIGKYRRKNMNMEHKCEDFFSSRLSEFEQKIRTGVDINRNYSTSNWGKSDGSSSSLCDDGYRGEL